MNIQLPFLWAFITLFLMTAVTVSGSYFLYKILIPGETTRKYGFGEEVEGGCFIELTAPRGFIESEEVMITNSKIGGYDLEEYVPLFMIMRGNFTDRFIDLGAAINQEETFELSKSMQITVGYGRRDADESEQEIEAPYKLREVEISRSRKPDLILGIIALLALSFTIPSGMFALWELLF